MKRGNGIIFRVPRVKDYTVMANQHLQNRSLSFKAKGLLSTILSLPPTWNYCIEGLASLTPDCTSAVKDILCELEKYGYLRREQKRLPNGQMGEMHYTVSEIPQ